MKLARKPNESDYHGHREEFYHDNTEMPGMWAGSDWVCKDVCKLRHLIAEDVECLRKAVGYDWPDKNSQESKHLVFEGVKALSRAAELGSAVAQYYVGQYYALGRVVPKDDSLALEWYEKAAAQKYTEAFNAVGVKYLEGKGTNVDFYRAHELFHELQQKSRRPEEKSWKN